MNPKQKINFWHRKMRWHEHDNNISNIFYFKTFSFRFHYFMSLIISNCRKNNIFTATFYFERLATLVEKKTNNTKIWEIFVQKATKMLFLSLAKEIYRLNCLLKTGLDQYRRIGHFKSSKHACLKIHFITAIANTNANTHFFKMKKFQYLMKVSVSTVTSRHRDSNGHATWAVFIEKTTQSNDGKNETGQLISYAYV